MAIAALGLALALALVAPVPASAAQGAPACAADKTLAVTFEARDGGRAVPLVATHEVSVIPEWSGEIRNPALSVQDGVRVLELKPRQARLIAPAGASLAMTASWEQAADPSDPDSDPSEPATRCVATRTVELPVTAAEPPQAFYDIAGRRPDYSSLAVVPDREAGDHSPLEVSVRISQAARFPSRNAKARTMSVAMRPSERVRYRKHIPSPEQLITPLWCRSYNLTCGLGRLFVEVDTLRGARYRNGRVVKRSLLSNASLPRRQPRRDVAPDGVRVNAFSFSPRPDREPRVFDDAIGYDIQVHQSGRLVARMRRVIRCGKAPGPRYYCHLLRRKNG